MATGTGKSTKTTAEDMRAATGDEVPDWAVPDADEQQLEQFIAPVDGQWRRGLSEHEMLAWISMQANMGDGDSEAVGLSMMAQVVGAATLEDAISGRVDTTKSREILDTIVECNWIKFIKSDKEDGCPYFAILDVRTTTNNEQETISLGGWMAVGQAGRMLYQSLELPADSPFLVPKGTPGAWPREPFPHYFKVKQKPTPKGHMNYLAPAMS